MEIWFVTYTSQCAAACFRMLPTIPRILPHELTRPKKATLDSLKFFIISLTRNVHSSIMHCTIIFKPTLPHAFNVLNSKLKKPSVGIKYQLLRERAAFLSDITRNKEAIQDFYGVPNCKREFQVLLLVVLHLDLYFRLAWLYFAPPSKDATWHHDKKRGRGTCIYFFQIIPEKSIPSHGNEMEIRRNSIYRFSRRHEARARFGPGSIRGTKKKSQEIEKERSGHNNARSKSDSPRCRATREISFPRVVLVME